MSKKNPVKKGMDATTRPATHRDRKKDLKRGKLKHKASDPGFYFLWG